MMSSTHSTVGKRWILLLVLVCLVIDVEARKGAKFNREDCRDEILAAQELDNFTFNTPEYFLQDDKTLELYNGERNMTLTLFGCDYFCGPWTFYWDAGPRVTTWILPILLLLSNIELSPIDKKRFMTILHALGDPIDSFWSLIHKIYVWHRLYAIGLSKTPPKLPQEKIPIWMRAYMSLKIAFMRKKTKPRSNMKELDREERARVIATVLAGFEEISGFGIETEDYYHMITRDLGQLGAPNEDRRKFEDWRRTARILADARTNEFSRTLLAIVVYIFGLVAAFIPNVGGGNTSPPGGRIGSAIFLSWLVPLALLSNTIGTFTSRRTCLTIMRQFVWTVSRIHRNDSIWTTNSGRISQPPNYVQDGPPASNPTHGTTEEDSPISPRKVSGIHSQRKDSNPQSPGTRDPQRVSFSQHLSPKISHDEHVMSTLQLDSTNRVSVGTGRIGTSAPESTSQIQLDEMEREPLMSPRRLSRVGTNPGQDNIHVSDGAPQAEEETVDLIRKHSWDQYWESLQWRGAIYTYRPWKVLYLDTEKGPGAYLNNIVLVAIACIPVAVSVGGASYIIYDAVPRGFSCRHVWVIVITILWIVSATLTSTIYAFFKTPTNGHKIWKIVLYKDAFIGVGSVGMVLLSTVGAFNYCWCWSAYMQRRENAYVPLITESAYKSNAKSTYSVVVAASIGAQLIFFVAIMIVYRSGLRLVRWTEERRREEWTHEMQEPPERTDDTYLLFWYKRNQLRKASISGGSR